jgi:hypothetical protein
VKLLRDLYNKLKRAVSKETYRAPRELVLKSKPESQFGTRRERVSRAQHKYNWCAAFNRRNGHVVPEKSTESIYYAAHRRNRA